MYIMELWSASNLIVMAYCFQQGQHTVSDFIKFIAQKASYPLQTFGMDGRKLTEKTEL